MEIPSEIRTKKIFSKRFMRVTDTRTECQYIKTEVTSAKTLMNSNERQIQLSDILINKFCVNSEKFVPRW